jgi:hypothetical protein
LAFFDVCLAEGERQEPDLPVRARGETGEQMLVGIAGERAPVVPCGSEHSSHNGINTHSARRYSQLGAVTTS